MQARQLSRLKARLLADPSLVDARAAAVRVIQARRRCPKYEAEWRLSFLVGTDEMQTLLRRMLPEEEWGRFRPGVDLCEVVGFPFYHDMMMENLAEMRDEGYRFEYEDIPIVCLNPSADGQYPEDVALACRLAILLNRPEAAYSARDQTALDDRLWSEMQRDYNLQHGLRPTGWVSPNLFGYVFGKQRNPLRHVPSVIRLIEYDTGSVFMDFNPEDGYETGIQWTRENVLWLRDQYQLARRIAGNLRRLAAWIDADPAPRLAAAFRLYRKAQNLTRDEQRKVRSEAAAGAGGGALVTVL